MSFQDGRHSILSLVCLAITLFSFQGANSDCRWQMPDFRHLFLLSVWAFSNSKINRNIFSANLQAWRSCYRNLSSDICHLLSDFWPLIWWAQEDSNLRPHAYQACALTTWAMSPYASYLLACAGGDNRDRTDDPLLAKQVLSQLSYTPMVWGDK